MDGENGAKEHLKEQSLRISLNCAKTSSLRFKKYYKLWGRKMQNKSSICSIIKILKVNKRKSIQVELKNNSGIF